MTARTRTAGAVALAAGALAWGATSSAAAAPWETIARGQMDISEQVGLARTADGTLHVAWHRHGNAIGTGELLHTAISPGGKVGATTPIVSGWATVGDPALLATPDGLNVVFPALETEETGAPRNGLDLATSGDGGRSWTVAPSAIYVHDFVDARTPAGVPARGQILQAWYAAEETVVHAGLDPAVPAQRGYGPGALQQLAADGSGRVVVAWCAATTGPRGVFAQSVDPAGGAAVGAPARMPGSTAKVGGRAEASCPAFGRVALVARGGGRFYVAATDRSEEHVRVWRVGAGRSATVSRGGSAKAQVALAAAPDGRLWVAWRDGDDLVYRRSNRDASVFGATVHTDLPAHQESVWALDLSSAPDGGLDVVARGSAVSNVVSLFVTRVRPGLSLGATGREKVTFRVTDAGDPVARATVTVAGRTLRTGADGRASADLPAGRFEAVARKGGYVEARARVRSVD